MFDNGKIFKMAFGIGIILFVIAIVRTFKQGFEYVTTNYKGIITFFTTELGAIVLLLIFGGLTYFLGFRKLLKKVKLRSFLSFLLTTIVVPFEIYLVISLDSRIPIFAMLIGLNCLKIYYLFFNTKLSFESITPNIISKKSKPRDKETFTLRIGKRKKVVIENPFAGVYVQAGAGSGKSESLLKPMIKQGIEQNFAYIMYDFKGDLSEFENEVLEYNNFTPSNVLNFKNPLKSDRFNPLNPSFISTTPEVSELTKTLFYNLNPGSIKQTNDNYFLQEAMNVFTGLTIYLKNKHPQYCTIPHIISSLSQVSLSDVVNQISRDIEALPYIASLRNVISLGADKQVAGVAGSLQGSLAKFSSKELFWILSGNDFTPDLNNPENPQRLTIVNDSVLPQFYGPLIALVISICLKSMNKPGQHKSALYLDEAPTLYIPGLEQIPATARSNKIATIYACQDYTQIVDKYGKEKAQTIISNLASQFFGRTTNVDSIKLISELFGKYDKTFVTQTKGSSNEMFDVFDKKYNKGKGQSIQERYRVTSEHLTQLVPGQFYSIIGNEKIMGERFNQVEPFKERKREEADNVVKVIREYATDYDLESNYIAITKEVQSLFKTQEVI